MLNKLGKLNYMVPNAIVLFLLYYFVIGNIVVMGDMCCSCYYIFVLFSHPCYYINQKERFYFSANAFKTMVWNKKHFTLKKRTSLQWSKFYSQGIDHCNISTEKKTVSRQNLHLDTFPK